MLRQQLSLKKEALPAVVHLFRLNRDSHTRKGLGQLLGQQKTLQNLSSDREHGFPQQPADAVELQPLDTATADDLVRAFSATFSIPITSPHPERSCR